VQHPAPPPTRERHLVPRSETPIPPLEGPASLVIEDLGASLEQQMNEGGRPACLSRSRTPLISSSRAHKVLSARNTLPCHRSHLTLAGRTVQRALEGLDHRMQRCVANEECLHRAFFKNFPICAQVRTQTRTSDGKLEPVESGRRRAGS